MEQMQMQFKGKDVVTVWGVTIHQEFEIYETTIPYVGRYYHGGEPYEREVQLPVYGLQLLSCVEGDDKVERKDFGILSCRYREVARLAKQLCQVTVKEYSQVTQLMQQMRLPSTEGYISTARRILQSQVQKDFKKYNKVAKKFEEYSKMAEEFNEFLAWKSAKNA